MEKFEILFTTECKMKTVLGFTECKAEKKVSMEKAADIYMVDEIVEYLCKAIDAGSDVSITAELLKDYSHCESFSRLLKDYKGCKTGKLIAWQRDGRDYYRYDIENINKKYIKQWYLGLIQRAKIDYIDNPAYWVTSA